jgi:uncharacterized membrane protein
LILLYKYEKIHISTKDGIVLSLAGICLSLCKAGYFPVLFLAILIPNNKFDSMKNAVISKALMILPCILITVWTYYNAAGNVASDGVLSYYSINYIFTNFFDTLKIYFNTLFEFGDYHFISGLLSGFGWYTQYARNFTSSIMSYSFVVLILLNDVKNETPSKNERISFLLSFVMICILIYTSMFLAWTQTDSKIVSGLQPRYFIVPLLLLGLSVQNNALTLNKKNGECVYIIASSGFLIVALITIMGGYYLG